MVRSESALCGMKEISGYVSRSAPTVLSWIKKRRFPAWQDGPGGVWMSDRNLIDDWNRAQVETWRKDVA